jgi:hypothetical protein
VVASSRDGVLGAQKEPNISTGIGSLGLHTVVHCRVRRIWLRHWGSLHQANGTIAFFSRALMPRHCLAAYERELIGLSQAVRHWRPCLWGRAFIVRTDH